ncbi:MULTISPECIES: CvpA family protein [unclassified Xanthomonas]|uniref:CvpA family protein n=1 Tax=unclassified Xanthomonas TaxID=2643310 RepID=UPI00163A7517|nr:MULTISPECIES: CvpA family protein [unclassified Xanthomonas]QNH13746.1 colicin V production protein [Xanthomonas sp. SI]QNH17962.1 colicin V production protein [Xanthomonas sp. SS]
MIDMVLLAVILVSALLGALRGFVGIVVGTLSWLLAGWATFQFGGDAGRWLADGAHPSMTYYLGGYALTFVVTMAVVGITGMVIRSAVRATALSGTDRALGFGLGTLRGGFFAAVLVLLMSFTPLTREPAWRQSVVLPVLSPGVHWMRAQLPDWRMPQMPQLNMSQMNLQQMNMPQMDLGKLPLAGDNAALGNALSASGLQEVMSKALGRPGAQSAQPGGDPNQVLPANIDPAQARPAANDPARVESNGQARPPSQ